MKRNFHCLLKFSSILLNLSFLNIMVFFLPIPLLAIGFYYCLPLEFWAKKFTDIDYIDIILIFTLYKSRNRLQASKLKAAKISLSWMAIFEQAQKDGNAV